MQNVKQSGCDLVIGMMLPTSGRFRDDSGTYKISATQKSEFVKYLKTTFSPHIRRLNAHNLRYQKQDRFWIGWFQIWQLKLTAQPVNCAKCFLKVSARLVTVLSFSVSVSLLPFEIQRFSSEIQIARVGTMTYPKKTNTHFSFFCTW